MRDCTWSHLQLRVIRNQLMRDCTWSHLQLRVIRNQLMRYCTWSDLQLCVIRNQLMRDCTWSRPGFLCTPLLAFFSQTYKAVRTSHHFFVQRPSSFDFDAAFNVSSWDSDGFECFTYMYMHTHTSLETKTTYLFPNLFTQQVHQGDLAVPGHILACPALHLHMQQAVVQQVKDVAHDGEHVHAGRLLGLTGRLDHHLFALGQGRFSDYHFLPAQGQAKEDVLG